MAVNTAPLVWSPYKELYHTVESAILRQQQDAIQDLEVALRKHKPDFMSLLQNPAKNTIHRQAVKKADIEGLPIYGQQGSAQFLTQQFIEEALIISDLFDLNEYAAVELLLAGENQKPYFPGLTRGLVSVLLYYDGRASLTTSLRTLLQAREGRTWSLGLSEEVTSIATKFTDQVMNEGLVNRILELIRKMDLTTELAQLQKERALGHAKHRKQVMDKMKEVKSSLADCLFCWSCQNPMNKEDTLQLINHLRNDISLNADGSIDDVTLTLLMALLYCLDVRILDQEDAEAVILKLPIISDPSYIPDIHREITSPTRWAIPGLRAVVQFAWGLTLRAYSQYPSAAGGNEYCEQDEVVVDMAIDEDAFLFLQSSVINSTLFHKEEFYIRQIHGLITDFIVQMPLKVKELRNRGDETARIIIANIQEGLEPPVNLKRDFEHMLLMIADLYSKATVELALEYWCPAEQAFTPSVSRFTSTYNYGPPQRQISLNKFVRLAGDLLSPPLFIPYAKMLSGLANGPQCAYHCFNLLKTNSMTGGSQVYNVSWDHFFQSMEHYYNNLRQEMPLISDLAHVYRHHPKGITPQEVDGLAAVLHLTRKVAEQDETARITLAENQQWQVLMVLWGLVRCCVPPKLKAELLQTLAALAKSPEISASLWNMIEASQILPTTSTTSAHQTGGIQVELDEVEARNEEFPMTLAFLELMNTLTQNPIPAGLGAGYRAPGFQPYLEFLKDSVFLKFNTRAYKDPAEKWAVAAAVLEILHKLMLNHKVTVEDFYDQPVEIQGEGTGVANKLPGHVLMHQMLNDTPMLREVLHIIDEAAKLLNRYIPVPGKENLEKSSLLCLQLVEVTLDKQHVFLDALRERGATMLVSQMDKLLMGINPRSGKADHLLNVARYVTFNSYLPEHALSAVKILFGVCNSPLVQPKIVGLLTANETLSQELLHGFVESLEADNPEDIDNTTEDDETEEEESVAQIRSMTRQYVMHLMLATLNQSAPNLGHYLLGFELRKPVNKTNLQDPGVLDSPRTCLHSILYILDRGVEARGGPTCLYEMPKLADLAYHLIYVLCANKDTSSPVMRYLRTAHDFLYRHMQHVPFQLPEGVPQTPARENLLLSQQSWLLKSVAIELRLTSANRQRSHTQRLVNLLLDDTPVLQTTVFRADGTFEPDYTQYEPDFTMYNTTQNQVEQTITGGQQARRKILSILDSINFSETSPTSLELSFYPPARVEQSILQCEQKTNQGSTFCNVRLLHKTLTNDLNNWQGAISGQRPHVLEEIEKICTNVVSRNSYRDAVVTKRQAFDAWRQVVEIVLTACPADLLQGEPRQNVLFELLQDLLLKVSQEAALPELSAPVAGVLLTLMANLRQCFLTHPSEVSTTQHTSHHLSLLEDAAAVPANQTSVFGQVTGTRTLFSSSLHVVLKGLIEHIMRSSSGLQRVRANLYGSLLYYLQISQKAKPDHNTGEGGVVAKLVAKENEIERLSQENLAIISGYGENFMEVLSRDSCDGHDVCRMLALASLDSIITFDKYQQWLSFLSSKGYIQHIVDSVRHDDEQLYGMLQPQPEPLRALYIFESKMSLLTRIAESATGAHMLLQCGVMSRLSECNIFDLRPETDRPGEGFVPTVLSRYRQQILFPVLRLCLALLTSLGIENQQAAKQVLIFVISHVDIFSTILRDKQSSLNLEALQELALTTAVISRAAIDDGQDEFSFGNMADMEFRGHVARIQQQMIGLLPRSCMSDKLHKQVKNIEVGAGPEGLDVKAQIDIAIQEVASNVVAFCRGLISKSGSTSQMFRILFSPSLSEAMSRDLQSRTISDYQSCVRNPSRPHSLGLVIYMMWQCVEQFLVAFDSHKQTQHKLASIPDLSSEDLKELCGTVGSEKMSAQQKHLLAYKRLTRVAAFQSQQLHLFAYIIENCLFILWRHLEFYLLHCVPSDQGASLSKIHSRKQQHLRKLHDMSGDQSSSSFLLDEEDSLQSDITRDELEQLKLDVVSCINESLFKKLQEIEQCYMKTRTRYGFVEALVRRIKRLLRLHTGS